jgi:hypothetical protein
VNLKNVVLCDRFLAAGLRKAQFTVTAGLIAIVLCGVACLAQDCSQFTLTAQPSSKSVRPKDTLSFAVTLANKSAEPVTVVSRELPNTWAVYQKAGTDWVALSSGGLVRGSVNRSLPEKSPPSVPDLFPTEEYKHVPAGGVLESRYDLSEELWKAVSGLNAQSPLRIRVVLGYNYEASPDEAKLSMLQCNLRTAPIYVQVVLKGRPRDHQPSPD